MVERLNLEETLENLKKWRECGDEDALTLLVLSNQGLVKHFARKYASDVISREDLESIGNEAMIRAIHRFDYINKSIHCFSTYIGNSIEHEISIQFRKNNKHSHVISFNQPIYEDKDGDVINIGSLISSDSEKDFDRQDNTILIKQLLACLTEKECQIIILRYGLDGYQERSLEEVGQILGYTIQGVHYQEQKALKKMKNPTIIKDYIF